MDLKRIVSIKGRPRLRDRVRSTLTTEENKAQADINLNTWDSFQVSMPPPVFQHVCAR